MKAAKRVLIVSICAGSALVLALLFYVVPKGINCSADLLTFANAGLQGPAEPRLAPKKAVRTGEPTKLTIASIDVDAAVEPVGLATDGTMSMDIKKPQEDVAWYRLGPRPGEVGSAVIAGHYGTWKDGNGSVFDGLHTLSSGDKIVVTDDRGVDITFVVRESRRFDPGADATDVFGSDDRKAHLNLITCEGAWNDASQSFSKRLVIFTDKE